MELDWVSGKKDVPGKPIQYSTTENSKFNILDLPTIETSSAGLIDTSSTINLLKIF